jgi:ATP-dependent helicase/nuclease subunit A
MGIKFTADQSAAIHDRSRSVLVSAAAGSGKTRVLTERLMAYVTDENDPRDIDSFLVITYTRAAAAELRGRILSELMARSAQEPENRRLRRQANLCYRAQIGTIHSFCTQVLRENAHSLGLSPDFRVLDGDMAETLAERCCEQVLEEAYDEMDEPFRALVDTVGAGRDDSRLANMVLTLHEKMQSHPDPEKWAREQSAALFPESDDAADTVWGAYLLEKGRSTASYWADELDRLIADMALPGFEKIQKAYSPSVEDTALALRDLLRSDGGWDGFRAKLPVPFPRLGALRASTDEAFSESVKARREACKKTMEKLAKQFAAPSAELLRAQRAMAPAMRRLLELTLRFSERFSAEKRRRGGLDFSDLEHLALKLLTDADGNPTELARRISERYTEIMVDEYQDVNAVQDTLFRAVSRGGHNLFMVGDVKQSIYRFRLADPGIFLEKYRSFKLLDEAAPGESCRILLRENFRSRACVLEAANHVFRNIMSRELGELDYDEEAALRCGADYYPPEGEKSAKLCIVRAEGDEDSPESAAAEPSAVADMIRKLVDSGTLISDGGAQRPLRWGDIAILLRSPGRSGGDYAYALAERGIPVAAGRGEPFFSSPEISALVSLLAVVDNPRQDVPLISVLRSAYFGFSADELAAIRAASKSGSFYDALCLRAESDAKCAAFLEKLGELRDLAPDTPTDEMILRACEICDAFAVAAAMPSGGGRNRNILRLLEYGRKFEEDGFRGLFRFVASLRRMMERGEEPELPAESGDSVAIMSIHKSKGLEFPVVFLCDTARRFNRQDAAQTVLIHSELGLGAKYTDAKRGIEYPTLARRAIAAKMNEELLSEEVRVLYVAMTRAKERLFVTCSLKDPERTIDTLRQGLRSPLPAQELAQAQSMAQWLIRAAMLEDSRLELSVYGESSESAETAAEQYAPQEPDAASLERMEHCLSFKYPHGAAVAAPSKLTATELKASFEPDPESEPLIKQRSKPFRLPEIGAERELTGAERGTAAHLVMQYIDFTRTSDAESVRGEIERLRLGGYLTDAQAAAVPPELILGFFRSELGRRMLASGEVLRELPFSLLVDAENYCPGCEGDQLLLQGVIDCCFAEGGEFYIIDYKTDYVNPNTAATRAAEYAPQIRAYAMAVSRMTGRPVAGAALYFLRTGCTAELSADGENLKIHWND